MSKIIAIISKNLKIMMRSRVSSLIIIFGPLFLTLFVGLAFSNSSLNSIKVGVYAPSYNNLTDSFINKTQQAKLAVIKFSSEETCSEAIKHGTVNICMVFPENFAIAKNSSGKASNMITFYVDPSQMNLVYGVIDLISSQVESRKQELSSELTTIILTAMDNTKNTVASDQPLIVDMIKSNEIIKSRSEGIKTKLSAIDLNFNSNKFGTDQLVEARNTIDKAINGRNLTISMRLNQSMTAIDKMMADPSVNGTSLYDQLYSIKSRLRSIDNDIKDVEESAIPDLDQVITALEKSVQETSDKFATLKTNRDSIINSDVKDISNSVDALLNKVMAIKADMDSIKTEIDSIQVKETSSIVAPIRTTIKPLVSENYLNYMFPSLIALVVMLVTLMFAETVVMMERKSTAYFRNVVTPTRENIFILSNFLTTMLLLILQLLLILGVSMLVFKVDILANFLPTMVVLLFMVALFTLIGITVGTVFSSPETATLGAISVGSMGLFLSDVLLPLESMPAYIQVIARFNPFVVGEHLLRSTIIFKSSLGSLFTENYSEGPFPAIYIIMGYIVIMTIILLISNELIKRSVLEKKTAPKKLKPGQVPVDSSDLAGDPVEKIDTLVKTAFDLIKAKEYPKASLIYVHMNEIYAHLPKEKKKEYFKKIIQIHQQLEKASKSREEPKKK